MKNKLLIIVLLGMAVGSWIGCNRGQSPVKASRILMWIGEGGKDSSMVISAASTMKTLAAYGLPLDTTSNPEWLHDDSLKKYAAVVLFGADGNQVPYDRQAYLERYVQAGGGLVGIDGSQVQQFVWPWFNLASAQPGVSGQLSKAMPVSDTHKPTDVQKAFDGGKVVFLENVESADFQERLASALKFAANTQGLAYAKATSLPTPENNRFVKEVYLTNLDEPMELEILPNKKIMFVERKGAVKLYDPATDSVRTIARVDVHTLHEDGLLGLALDPDFKQNGWVYFFYSPNIDRPIQRVARFTMLDDSLIMASEKVLIEIDVQRDECCHSGGSLEFGPGKNLFISVGDNTNPFASDGYGPQDERPDRSSWDAQRSSSNLNDLRGAVLRIHPTPEGGYTIPEGNLLPADTKKGRPEIFVKGCRNPYRIGVDQRKNWLYWGDVGPDAGEDRDQRGPRGHDEVNVATSAGYYGWPLFVGDNKAYYDYDFATAVSAPQKNPTAPLNTSPNNSGPQNLPTARPALVYYPYADSDVFPYVGKGGRTAMAGPTYYYDQYEGSAVRLPKYYHGKVFFYDWMRNWILAASMNPDGTLLKLEPFLSHLKFQNIEDMVISSEGEMFMLEYGKTWFAQNTDALLTHISYAEGNRAPKASLAADKMQGGAPLTVNFTAAGSADLDMDDVLSYEWIFPGKTNNATSPEASFTFEKNGTYKVIVKVKDQDGATSEASLTIAVGNEPPVVSVQFASNQTFFTPGTNLGYTVKVNDRENGDLTGNARIFFDYLSLGEDKTLIAQGQSAAGKALNGMALIEGSYCKSCHQMNVKSAGPSFMDIAARYGNDSKTLDYLTNKIINGGSGVWGETAMSAHPQLKPEEARAIASYLVDLELKGPEVKSLPASGTLAFKPGQTTGQYLFTLAAEDKPAGGQPAAMIRQVWKFRSTRLEAESAEVLANAEPSDFGQARGVLLEAGNGGYFGWNHIDLTGVKGFNLLCGANAAGTCELFDTQSGKVLGSVSIKPVGNTPSLMSLFVPINLTGFHNIGFRFVSSAPDAGAGFDWVQAVLADKLP